jgi:integrase
MLVVARKRGLIEAVPEFEWLHAPLPEFDFLDFDEAKRLIEAAEDQLQTMIVTALRTGMRHGELLALRWQDVDLVAGRIMVRQNVVRGVIGTPKSGRRARSRSAMTYVVHSRNTVTCVARTCFATWTGTC